jgi:hypothetical protein
MVNEGRVADIGCPLRALCIKLEDHIGNAEPPERSSNDGTLPKYAQS